MATGQNADHELTGGLKKWNTPQIHFRGEPLAYLIGRNESPWDTFKTIFTCDLAGRVSIAACRTHPSQLRAIRTFKKEESKEMLEKFKHIRHENVLLAREYYDHEDSVYFVFDDLPLTLKHVIGSDYYPCDAEVSCIKKILSGLSFLRACGYDHPFLTCSYILLGMDGTIQIAGLEGCENRSTLSHFGSIEAVASITILLMQKYKKPDGTKDIDNLDCWSIDSQAFQFLQRTDTASSIDELKEYILETLTPPKVILAGLARFVLISARTSYSYEA
ncbi:hypothetical protein BGW36DRAFT_453785 [Talaromyces proteolyticus]|uniref:Protein kinase domain-containing protein n=1 Tax=Talaromyces proteolyticus TaxID=1131652 RepID=A0AAD4KNK7_9EURO|nr:uncharacterized protein BGW36DRAFT_453785 [Talaromyces proteolyticus]KAH8695671.1 hypothetical protein BGW36DRAFT_453785 [Talaromyces proteolyticus]